MNNLTLARKRHRNTKPDDIVPNRAEVPETVRRTYEPRIVEPKTAAENTLEAIAAWVPGVAVARRTAVILVPASTEV